MKKLLSLSIIVLCSCFAINVNAENDHALEEDADYSSFQSTYNKYDNGEKITVNGSEMITLYGKSDCNGSSCTYNYAGLSSGVSFENALAKYVVCSGNEKNITYQNTGSGGKTDFMQDNKAKYDGIVYWSEDYYVTCTSESNGNNNVVLNQGVNNTTTSPTTRPTNDDYNSSNTVPSPETGVTEYFIILGLVAIVSYVGMVFVKKLNLFKKI